MSTSFQTRPHVSNTPLAQQNAIKGIGGYHGFLSDNTSQQIQAQLDNFISSASGMRVENAMQPNAPFPYQNIFQVYDKQLEQIMTQDLAAFYIFAASDFIRGYLIPTVLTENKHFERRFTRMPLAAMVPAPIGSIAPNLMDQQFSQRFGVRRWHIGKQLDLELFSTPIIGEALQNLTTHLSLVIGIFVAIYSFGAMLNLAMMDSLQLSQIQKLSDHTIKRQYAYEEQYAFAAAKGPKSFSGAVQAAIQNTPGATTVILPVGGFAALQNTIEWTTAQQLTSYIVLQPDYVSGAYDAKRRIDLAVIDNANIKSTATFGGKFFYELTDYQDEEGAEPINLLASSVTFYMVEGVCDYNNRMGAQPSFYDVGSDTNVPYDSAKDQMYAGIFRTSGTHDKVLTDMNDLRFDVGETKTFSSAVLHECNARTSDPARRAYTPYGASETDYHMLRGATARDNRIPKDKAEKENPWAVFDPPTRTYHPPMFIGSMSRQDVTDVKVRDAAKIGQELLDKEQFSEWITAYQAMIVQLGERTYHPSWIREVVQSNVNKIFKTTATGGITFAGRHSGNAESFGVPYGTTVVDPATGFWNTPAATAAVNDIPAQAKFGGYACAGGILELARSQTSISGAKDLVANATKIANQAPAIFNLIKRAYPGTAVIGDGDSTKDLMDRLAKSTICHYPILWARVPQPVSDGAAASVAPLPNNAGANTNRQRLEALGYEGTFANIIDEPNKSAEAGFEAAMGETYAFFNTRPNKLDAVVGAVREGVLAKNPDAKGMLDTQHAFRALVATIAVLQLAEKRVVAGSPVVTEVRRLLEFLKSGTPKKTYDTLIDSFTAEGIPTEMRVRNARTSVQGLPGIIKPIVGVVDQAKVTAEISAERSDFIGNFNLYFTADLLVDGVYVPTPLVCSRTFGRSISMGHAVGSQLLTVPSDPRQSHRVPASEADTLDPASSLFDHPDFRPPSGGRGNPVVISDAVKKHHDALRALETKAASYGSYAAVEGRVQHLLPSDHRTLLSDAPAGGLGTATNLDTSVLFSDLTPLYGPWFHRIADLVVDGTANSLSLMACALMYLFVPIRFDTMRDLFDYKNLIPKPYDINYISKTTISTGDVAVVTPGSYIRPTNKLYVTTWSDTARGEFQVSPKITMGIIPIGKGGCTVIRNVFVDGVINGLQANLITDPENALSYWTHFNHPDGTLSGAGVSIPEGKLVVLNSCTRPVQTRINVEDWHNYSLYIRIAHMNAVLASYDEFAQFAIDTNGAPLYGNPHGRRGKPPIDFQRSAQVFYYPADKTEISLGGHGFINDPGMIRPGARDAWRGFGTFPRVVSVQ
jgi:hypothetical protein